MTTSHPETHSRVVSVVIPAYNAERYLPATLQSALRQNVELEVIVVDDGSTDDTRGLAESVAAADQRVRVLTKPRGGVSAARNLGRRNASGRFIAFLDADDIWDDTFLETALDGLASEGAGLFVGLAHRFTEHPGDSAVVHGPTPRFVRGFPRSLVEDNPIVPAMVVMRREVCEAVGDFGPDAEMAEDWDYWLRCAEQGHRFVFDLSRPRVYYRRSAGSRTAQLSSPWICAEVFRNRDVSPLAPRRVVRRTRGRFLRYRARDEPDRSRALSFLLDSVRLHPWSLKTYAWLIIVWLRR